MSLHRQRAAIAGAIGIACAAHAGLALADGSEPPQSTAAPFSWTGYYVGAQLGGMTALSDVTDPLGRNMYGNPIHGPGAFIGGQAGYHYQDGIVVYGVEAELGIPQAQGTATCSAISGSFINSTCRVGTDAFGTLAGRLGLALGSDGRTLLYGKAGAAWSVGDVAIATNDMRIGADGNPYTLRKSDVSQWGWMLGAGAEYAMQGNWTLKAEYDFAAFGDQSITLPQSAEINSAGAITQRYAAREGDVSQNLHMFKLGLNYRFGASASDDAGAGVVSLKDSPASLAAVNRFEIGGRYWYSWGRYKNDLGNNRTSRAPALSAISRLTYDDLEASTGEVVGRYSGPWNMFAKGFIGGGSISGGRMNDEDFNLENEDNGNTYAVPYTNTISPKVDGEIPWYATFDVGYDFWRTPGYRFGAYVGYNYYREKESAYGVRQTANQLGPYGNQLGPPLPTSGHAIIDENAKWQSVRIGATGEFYLAPRLKLSADAAYLPYVTVNAVDHHYTPPAGGLSSNDPAGGTGVGTQLEVMLSYDITQQWSVGVGGRYWAMWTDDGWSKRVFPANATTVPQYQKLETERAGVLGQVNYKFD